MWTLLEKNFGDICIKISNISVDGESYLFAYGPDKKSQKITYTNSLIFSENEHAKQESTIL